MVESAGVIEERAAALRSLLPSGTVLSADYAGQVAGGTRTKSTVVGVGRRVEDVVVTFRWMDYPYLLSFALDPRRDYYDDDDESTTGAGETWPAADWAQNARFWLEEELDTGLVARASRQRHDDVIELSEPWWPSDSRFYLSEVDAVGEDPDGLWQGPGLFELDGLDTGTVRALRADGTLISWHRAYPNTRSAPYVGHAAVVRVDEETARIEFCDVRPDVPATVTLQLCLMAAHRASWHGARSVLTEVTDPALGMLGFRRTGGMSELDTQFLHVDHPAAAQLVAQTRRWRPSWKLRRRRRFGQWTRVGI